MRNWVPWGDREEEEEELSGKGFLIMVACVLVAGWLGFLPDDLVDRWSCSRSDDDVYRVKASWEVTVRANPPVGTRFNCLQYQSAAEQWNGRCAEFRDPFTAPETC